MNGPSPLSRPERELIFAYAAGTAGCQFVYVAHAAVAYAWGVEAGLVEALLEDIDAAPVEARLKPCRDPRRHASPQACGAPLVGNVADGAP
jgi:AhpD family alkylhydroperoxidase